MRRPIRLEGEAAPLDADVAPWGEHAGQHRGLFQDRNARGIVAVEASDEGTARVWRRQPDGTVTLAENTFPNWFLARDLSLLDHLPTIHLDAAAVRSGEALPALSSGSLAVVRLASDHEPAYRYLVLAERLSDVEPALLDACAKTSGPPAASLADLRGQLHVRPVVEQYLLITGQTFYRGLRYEDVHRLQFDLETTGLDEQRERIFMVSLRDSTGWQACLDVGSETTSEADLLRRFVEVVRERDPDVLENHNIFNFDLRFLVHRAGRLGVRLALGRDGSEPRAEADVLRIGEQGEPFTRYLVAGRQVVDTLHAVRRHGAAVRDLRRHGLKDAARYFGFARPDREYVPGAEIWATFQRDPERVRRYATDDAEEAGELSRRLLAVPMALAAMVPRPYERIATDASPAALLDPLLLRAYLRQWRALPVAAGRRSQAAPPMPRAELLTPGVSRNVRRVVVDDLPARVLVADDVRPAADALGAMPALARALLADQEQLLGTRADPDDAATLAAAAGARQRLLQTFVPYLGQASGALLADPAAAAHLAQRSRAVLQQLLERLQRRGTTPIELDGERLLVAVPAVWTNDVEQAELAVAGQDLMPAGLEPRLDARFPALYAAAPRSHILCDTAGAVQLIGNAFRSGLREQYGEQFVAEAAPLLLAGNLTALRQLFLDSVARLQAGQVPLDELCAHVILHKSPAAYRREPQREAAYEAVLASGQQSWRPGKRVRYFRHRAGSERLLPEGDRSPGTDADAAYYVQRLKSTYAQQLARAFTPEAFQELFAIPGETEGGADPSPPSSARLHQGALPI